MGRKKKVVFEEKKTVRCPVRGHKHFLELIPSEDDPEFLVAFCGDRAVHKETAFPNRPSVGTKEYKVPKFD